MAYLKYLDGVRAIAVLAVVIYHLTGSLVPNGYLGVDVFFVVSGFIVSYAVAGRSEGKSFFGFVTDFYARRFTRIMPALMFCLLISALLTFLFIPDAWRSRSITDTAHFAFFGLSNIFLSRGTDYFSPATAFNPFTHTWSLGVEEQFYVVFPLLFFPWVIGLKKLSAGVYAAAFVASIAVWFYLFDASALKAFYMPYARFWQLALGVLCFQLVSRMPEMRGSRSINLLAFVGLAALLVAMFVDFGNFQWIEHVIAAIGTALLVGGLYVLRSKIAAPFAVLEARPARFIGKISYSLYLWHWPIFVIARWTVGTETIALKAAALIVAVALSLISYFWVETPARYSQALRSLPNTAVVAIFLAIVGASWYGFTVMDKHRDQIALSTVTRNKADWYPSAPNRFKEYPGCVVAQKVVQGASYYTRSKCGEAREETLFVLGDSHAGAYVGMLKRFTVQTGITSAIVWIPGCPYIALTARDSVGSCKYHAKRATDFIVKNAKAGDLVFLPSLRVPRITGDRVNTPNEDIIKTMLAPDQQKARDVAIDIAIKRLTELSRRGIRIVFEAPKPVFRIEPYRCSDWFNATNAACAAGNSTERDFVERLRVPVLDGFTKIAEKVPNTYVWDPLPVLCPSKICQTSIGGRPLFFDGDHLSGYANRFLVDAFSSGIENVIEQSRANQEISSGK